MTPEINISVSNNSQKQLQDLIQEWGKDGLELEGRGFINPTNGICGFFIHEKGNSSNIIDVFLQPNNQLEESVMPGAKEIE